MCLFITLLYVVTLLFININNHILFLFFFLQKTGPRLCCPACKVTAHTGCISTLIDKQKIHCKPTFKDGVRQYREVSHQSYSI